jgi:DNA-binding LacI/PurR family transcriptional regulator
MARADRPRTTIQDLAKSAGVSVKTVSKALREYRGEPVAGLAAGTYKKVVQRAQAIGYPLERPAGRKRRAGRIGVVLPDLEAVHYLELARRIIQEATRFNLAVVIEEASNDDPVAEGRAIALFSRLDVAAVIMTSSRFSADFAAKVGFGGTALVIAMVCEDPDKKTAPEDGLCRILLDHEPSSFQVTQTLIDMGHQKIAFLSGPSRSVSNRAKLAGYKHALGQNSIPFREDLVISDSDVPRWDFGTGSAFCERLLDYPPEARPTAIMAYNDELALGAMHTLQEKGISVPGQMSVVGYDDIKYASFWEPTLTTVDVHRKTMAERAVAIARGWMTRPEQAWMGEDTTIVPSFVRRASIANAPAPVP